VFTITELPRLSGVVDGLFRARHSSSSFSNDGAGFKFVAGTTVEPVLNRVADRLHAAYGNDVCFIPCDKPSADKALGWMRSNSHPAARIERVAGQAYTMFAPTEPAPAEPSSASSTPTTWAEIEALPESQVRALAAELGCTDKRMKELRLRRFIADELEIDRPGLPDGD
jgi:hypothetical protein